MDTMGWMYHIRPCPPLPPHTQFDEGGYVGKDQSADGVPCLAKPILYTRDVIQENLISTVLRYNAYDIISLLRSQIKVDFINR